MAKLKTVENWECDLNVNLITSLNTDRKNVEILKCSVCMEFSTRICSIAGFSQAWVDGTTSVKLDSLKKHVQGRANQHAKHFFDQKTLEEQFATQVVKQSPIQRGMLKMVKIDRKVMLTCFNTTYYLGWINHKLKAMETFVANYGAYMFTSSLWPKRIWCCQKEN